MWRTTDAIQGREGMTPLCMSTKHRSNIFTLDFSCDNAFIYSGGKRVKLEGKILLLAKMSAELTLNNSLDHNNTLDTGNGQMIGCPLG